MASLGTCRWLSTTVLFTLLAAACSDKETIVEGAGGQSSATGGHAGASTSTSGGTSSAGGASHSRGGNSSLGGTNTSLGGTTPSLGGSVSVGGSSGTTTAPLPAEGRWIESGTLNTQASTRPDFGGLVVANDGTRSYVVESRREVTQGPLGLPWRTRFRLAAYEGGKLLWAYVVDPDDLIGDVVVHPSGDLTLAWEAYGKDELAYQLVRLGRDGTPKSVTTVPAPLSIPESDHAASEPRPLLRMKSPMADATTAGWLRLMADGENVVMAVLSYVNVKVSDVWSNRLALAIEAMRYESSGYAETWARLVDGSHVASPAAWAYDELRWREQAVRPFFTRDASTGEWLVGRAWNRTRCAANRTVFSEFTAEQCALVAVDPLENERLPLAVTRFSTSGTRLGTKVIAPEPDAPEQVPFALLARDGRFYVAGSIVRNDENGAKRTYPDTNGFVDYDSYVGLYDGDGKMLAVRDVNLGRGDVLAALRFTPGGLVGVGSSGWDRWQGGMSISRGADPLLVWMSADVTRVVTRTTKLSDGTRHFGLHDVAVFPDHVEAFGFADAPMTHSADVGPAARTFGGLTLSAAQ